MKIVCPYGWKTVTKLAGNLIWEDHTVDVLDGICDSPDLCGIASCEFYDDSPRATRAFCQTLNHAHTLEGLIEDQKDPNRDLKPYRYKYYRRDEGPPSQPQSMPVAQRAVTAAEMGSDLFKLVRYGLLQRQGLRWDGWPEYRLTQKGLAYIEQTYTCEGIEQGTFKLETVLQRISRHRPSWLSSGVYAAEDEVEQSEEQERPQQDDSPLPEDEAASQQCKHKPAIELDEFDTHFNELLEKGFIQQIGTNPDGEPEYRLSKKAVDYFDREALRESIKQNSPEKIAKRIARNN
jgi:hypothetical protein